MKKLIYSCILLLFVAIPVMVFAQQGRSGKTIDSLVHQLAVSKDDTSRVLTLRDLCDASAVYNFDSVAVYGKRGVALAQKIGFARGEVKILYAWQSALEQHGDIPQSMELNFKGLQIAQEKQNTYETALGFSNIAGCYWDLQDYPKAISFYKKALQVNKMAPQTPEAMSWHVYTLLSLGDSYSEMNRLDSAFFYLHKIYNETLNNSYHRTALLYLGDVLFKMGDHKTGFAYLHKSIELNEKRNDHYTSADACKTIARFFKETNEPDSAIFYAKKGLAHAQAIGFRMDILINSKILADNYEHKDINQAYYYLKLTNTVNDELFGQKKVRALQKIFSEEQHRDREAELKRITHQNQLKQNLYLTGLAIVLLIAFILYRQDKQRQKANTILEKTLTDLRSTQTQLVQKEKMASLGELTAGIAHEIQNPLNFVNNFSDVNREMLDELKAELKNGNLNEVLAIAEDIQQNEEKINHHGKRADAIVKSMLQHSKTSTGIKEPTLINNLCDEYSRLSYHGLRAKDKNFSADINTAFDESIGKINIVPQDLGRVLLNLFNNAFYAVNEKKKIAGENYQPVVSVQTKKIIGAIEIRISDNGTGITQNIVGKIFQPFFTTKPAGQGTGLGLSLAYDIVNKEHGGSIEVETQETKGSTFIIRLPVTDR